jgi:hypothetical protein
VRYAELTDVSVVERIEGLGSVYEVLVGKREGRPVFIVRVPGAARTELFMTGYAASRIAAALGRAALCARKAG